MSKHPYDKGCTCDRCNHERVRRTAESLVTKANDPVVVTRKRKRSSKERIASREEQHARLIDCGYNNWDDRE